VVLPCARVLLSTPQAEAQAPAAAA
jgi:hypothetical protein